MTTLNSYNFMDLLKDHNYVPRVTKSESSLINDVTSRLETVTNVFSVSNDDYSFMDLVKDRSYSFSPIQVPANDNIAAQSSAA